MEISYEPFFDVVLFKRKFYFAFVRYTILREFNVVFIKIKSKYVCDILQVIRIK